MVFSTGEYDPESGTDSVGRNDSGGQAPSVCLLCPVPESDKESAFLENALSQIRMSSPTLLRAEILWISKGTSPPPDFFPNLPSTAIYPGPESQKILSAIRAFLKYRTFGLVEGRLLEGGLCRTLQKQDANAVPGEPLDPKTLGAPIPAGLYRTLVRTRAFRKGRRGIPFLRSAAGALLSRPDPVPGTLRILMYHRVADILETDILAVTPFAFACQMDWLRKEGWTVLPLREALRRLETGGLPPKAVGLTFDDGYRDNYEEAAPVLARLGFPATVFPVTGFVREEAEHRRYRGRDPKVPYLTVEQIREMKKSGFDFGGHTHTHPFLPQISCEAAQEEIHRAKKLLEEWTGETSTLFAYPNGAYGKEHFRILDALGYEAALSVRPGANRPGTLRFALRRTEISGRDSLGDFIKKMNGGFDLVHGLLQGVRGFYR